MDATGLEYLRARFYDPYLNRFTSRDPWDGHPNSPMSYNAWQYGLGNPITNVDPSGEYGREVHHDLTRGVAIEVGLQNRRGSVCGLVGFWAHFLALGDQQVDEMPIMSSALPGFLVHFAEMNDASADPAAAALLGEPILMGGGTS